MSLWDFALAAWRRPGVESACLALQDEHGQCIPLLLWRAWILAGGRGTPLEAAIALARDWDTGVISPLRPARRHATTRSEASVRDAVRVAELTAEQRLMEMLEALPTAPADEHASLNAALAGMMLAWNGASGGEALALVQALGRALPPVPQVLSSAPDGRPVGRS